ncbi:hypothetical protein ACFQ1R_15530 [Mariniflexile jejuense]|uniref:Uncharacterized protein n=1 Tax=Mariniflexile jejuense TaxID=1173582 RepID=A0ABW3JMW4_9FLAO
MMDANNSLKNNRSLLAKRKETKALEGSYANIELKKFPKATEAQLESIKHRIQNENKQKRLKLYVVSGFVLLIFISFILYILNK